MTLKYEEFKILLDFIFSFDLVLLIFIIITIYHTFIYFLRDRNYLKNLNHFKDFKIETINQLKEIPLINIILPAWKEGDNLKQCLNSINQLNYPKIKVILNASGSNETIEIADSFKNIQKFTVIYQKPGGGKLRAINDCIKYTSFLQADRY